MLGLEASLNEMLESALEELQVIDEVVSSRAEETGSGSWKSRRCMASLDACL